MNKPLRIAAAFAGLLALQAIGMGIVTVAKDGKSFAIKAAGNWTWTYTPTLVQ